MLIDISTFIDKKTLVGAFFGVGFVWVGEIAKYYYLRKQNAHYLIIRLIPVLEQFLDECYDVAVDDGTCQGRPASGDGTYIPQVKEPTLELPSDVDWKSIEQNLVEIVMKLPVEVYSINKTLSIYAEYGDLDNSDYMYSRQLSYSKLYLKVDNIISKLKKKLKQEPAKYKEHWNPREWCIKFIADHEKKMKNGRKK